MTRMLSIVNPSAEKPLGMSREGFERTFTFSIFAVLGIYGSFALFLEWPVVMFVGFVLADDRVKRSCSKSCISYSERILWAALGATAGGLPMWFLLLELFRPALRPFVLASPGICLIAGVVIGHIYRVVRRMLPKTRNV